MSAPLTVHLVAAARPNFMKIAPLYHALKATDWCDPILVHTGQHYDEAMSALFFEDLKLPKPDIDLEVGSMPNARQTAEIMLRLEGVFREVSPDCVLVVGDVNSTVAASLVAVKMGIPVALYVDGKMHTLAAPAPMLADYVGKTAKVSGKQIGEMIMPEKVMVSPPSTEP